VNGIRRHGARTQEKRNTQKFHPQNLKTAGVDGRVILKWALKWVGERRMNKYEASVDRYSQGKNPSTQIKKNVHLLLCHHKLH